MADGARVGWDDMLSDLSGAHAVLLGEQHDNADHHRLQARVLAALARGRPAPAVAVEMLDVELQPVLDDLLAGGQPTSADLARAAAWEDSGWPDFGLYAPVFEVALSARAPIIAGGLPRARAMKVASGKGTLDDAALRARYGLDEPLPEPIAQGFLEEMKAAHCGMLPEAMAAKMVPVQRLRDAMLADAVRVAIERAGRAVLIAGAGHVRKDRAVPALLSRIGVDAVRTVGFREVQEDTHDLASYVAEHGALFDYLVLTPRASDTDHCAAFRRSQQQ